MFKASVTMKAGRERGGAKLCKSSITELGKKERKIVVWHKSLLQLFIAFYAFLLEELWHLKKLPCFSTNIAPWWKCIPSFSMPSTRSTTHEQHGCQSCKKWQDHVQAWEDCITWVQYFTIYRAGKGLRPPVSSINLAKLFHEFISIHKMIKIPA